MQDLQKIVIDVLKKDERFISQEGDLLKNLIREKAEKLDENLIGLLLDNKKIKEVFFVKRKDYLVFDIAKFIRFLNNKEFLADSFTSFKNKTGLIDLKGDLITENNDVVLGFPFKDCVLAGGQNKEDVKRDEIFYNEILGNDDIDRLLDEKTLTNFKRINKDGENELESFKRDENGMIKDNLVIKGNNLLALHSLKGNFAGKIKLIYIDPPYYFEQNKPEDTFRYNSNFKLSTWLTFMKNRLEIAKELLSDDGVIFIQIDDGGQAYLKVLLDGIFGVDGFLSLVSVKAKSGAGASGGGEDKKLKKNTENILIYCKNNFSSFKNIYKEELLDDLISTKQKEGKSFEYNSVMISSGDSQYFSNIESGSGEIINVNLHKNYIIKSVKQLAKDEGLTTSEIYKKYYNKIFRTQDAQSSIRHKVVKATNKDGELYSIEYYPISGRNKGKKTTLFYYKNEMVNFLTNVSKLDNKGNIIKTSVIGTLWDDMKWDGIANEGGVKLKGGKKPEALLERIIFMSTEPGDIVLDYHLGSGTTCAVAHKTGRQYIGIEQMDYGEDDSVVRLKNVINGDSTGVSKLVDWRGGGDFVYMELKQANQVYIDNIKSSKTSRELINVYNQIKETGFINYNIDIKAIDENINEFEKLSLENQKNFLNAIIDKNFLYVNFSEIEDTNNDISNTEKQLNYLFYNK